ncbi:MAG: hypothetical protein ABIV05_09445 [Actinomycetota bacterium]
MTDEQLGPVRRVRVRRAPRYQAFVGAGVAVGVLTGLVIGLTGTADAATGRGRLLAYLVIGLALVGATVGGLVAVAFERTGRRRS